MRIVKVVLNSKKDITQKTYQNLYLGIAGENNVTQIQFDISSWVKDFGIGEVTLINQRSEDASPYPVNNIEVNNNIVTWTISSQDCARSGVGHCNLSYTVGSVIKKSVMFSTFVENTLGQSNTPPENYTFWIDELMDDVNDVKDLIPIPTAEDSGKVIGVNDNGKYELTEGGGPATQEVDPIFSNSPAATITSGDIRSWDTLNKLPPIGYVKSGKLYVSDSVSFYIQGDSDYTNTFFLIDTEKLTDTSKSFYRLDGYQVSQFNFENVVVDGNNCQLSAIPTNKIYRARMIDNNLWLYTLAEQSSINAISAINGLLKADGSGTISAVTSGTDIKTINNESILGSGNITIQGGGGEGTVTSVRVRATSPVQSSESGAQTSALDTTISLADGYGDTKNPYGTKNANKVLAGPSSGTDATPSFRALVADDIPSITKAKISDFPNALIGTTTNTTPTEVLTALQAGKPVYITHTDSAYGNLTATYFNYSASINTIASSIIFISPNDLRLGFTLVGDVAEDSWALSVVMIPQTAGDVNAQPEIDVMGLLKGNGDGSVSAATAGTDYQSPLVSGTNIKTINNESLLGSGNISISGGEESDPVFSASPAATITNNMINGWNKLNNSPRIGYSVNDGIRVSNAVSFSTTGDSDYSDAFFLIHTNKMNDTRFTRLDGGSAQGYFFNSITVDGTNCATGSLPLNKLYMAQMFDNVLYLTTIADKASVDAIGAISGIIKANGSGTISAAVSGTDYQAPLVSGTNIKTINNESLLGSGNISVGGGGSGSDLFVVNVTITKQYEEYSVSVDKTVTEILSAVNNDQLPIAIIQLPNVDELYVGFLSAYDSESNYPWLEFDSTSFNGGRIACFGSYNGTDSWYFSKKLEPVVINLYEDEVSNITCSHTKNEIINLLYSQTPIVAYLNYTFSGYYQELIISGAGWNNQVHFYYMASNNSMVNYDYTNQGITETITYLSPLVVSVTESEDNGGTRLTGDKTWDDIRNAYDSGRVVILKIEETETEDDEVTFFSRQVYQLADIIKAVVELSETYSVLFAQPGGDSIEFTADNEYAYIVSYRSNTF